MSTQNGVAQPDKFTWQPGDIVFLDEDLADGHVATESDDTAVQQVAWSPDKVDERLAEYRAQGVEYLKWMCQSNACDLCFANENQVRKVGDAFPNGAILPQCHPNCSCDTEPTEKPKES